MDQKELDELDKKIRDAEPWYSKVDDWMLDQKWWPYGINRFVKDIPWKLRQVKYFFMRGKNGWSPMDTWSFDCYLARVIKEGLEHMIKNATGYQTGLCSACKDPSKPLAKNSFEPADCTCEKEWPAIMQKIADGITAVDEFEDDDEANKLIHINFEAYKRLSDAAYATQKDALLLLAEHWNRIWD